MMERSSLGVSFLAVQKEHNVSSQQVTFGSPKQLQKVPPAPWQMHINKNMNPDFHSSQRPPGKQ